MPPGFDLVDIALGAIPVAFALLGLVRGAPAELASTLGCLVGVAAAWGIGLVGAVQALGTPGAPLVAIGGGLVVWRVTRNLTQMAGLDTRWFDLGGIVDMLVGFVMGGARGLALTGAGCLAYAVLTPSLELPSGDGLVTYPYYVAGGRRVTNAVMAAAPEPVRLATVPPDPGPVPLPDIAQPAPSTASVKPPDVPPLAAAAAPVAIPHPDVPVRGVPSGMYETHHNLRQPYGAAPARHPGH